MTDLSAELNEIERRLQDGVYRPGPWSRFLDTASRRSRAERVAVAQQVSRVSDKLHQTNHPQTFPFSTGLALELLATAAGLVLLEAGLKLPSAVVLLGSALVLSITFQPLIKLAVGHALGVRYSYFYLWSIKRRSRTLYLEPRFKMQYGTYLGASRWRRVLLHLSGAVGSPFALWWVAVRAEGISTLASAICEGLFFFLASVELLLFLGGLAGVRRLGPVGLVGLTSPGGAGYELRESVRSYRGHGTP